MGPSFCRGRAMLDVMQEADLIRRVTRKVYWNSRYARLRTQIDEEDLIQMVFLKLLNRDNYKRYSESYSLVGFLYRVANGCAISFSNKSSNIREWTILDQPTDDENDARTMMDALISDNFNVDLDTQFRLNRVSASMDPEVNPRVVIRYRDEDRPFSIEALFDFFIETKYNREEMQKHIINVRTNTPVTQSTFDKWWKVLEKSAKQELGRC